jgi:hypothetical protein
MCLNEVTKTNEVGSPEYSKVRTAWKFVEMYRGRYTAPFMAYTYDPNEWNEARIYNKVYTIPALGGVHYHQGFYVFATRADARKDKMRFIARAR